MIATLGWLVFGSALIVAGALAHEVVHAVAAKLVGGDVHDVDLFSLHVDFEAQPGARTRAVLLAPGILGIVTAPLLAFVWPSSWHYIAQFGLLIAWAVFTFNGGTDGEITLRRTEAS